MGHNYKDQERKKNAAGFIIEEQRTGKKVSVAQERLGVEEREDGEHQRKKRPEIELGKQQRVRLVKGEQVLQEIQYEVPERHLLK